MASLCIRRVEEQIQTERECTQRREGVNGAGACHLKARALDDAQPILILQ